MKGEARMEMIMPGDGTIRKRRYYMDTLKVVLTCLVIAHHASQAYGPTGGAWVYHNSNGIIAWLGNFMAVNMSFMMGLFFMISGFFLPASWNGQTLGSFIGKKLNRLMIPVLIIMFAIVPVYFYIADMLHAPSRIGFFAYYFFHYLGEFRISYEHGWYLLHLCLYSVVYAAVKTLAKNRKARSLPFKTYYVFVLALLVSVISYFVRLVFPIDRWINLLGFFALEPAHVPQYVLFFSFGILAGENDYFETIPKKTGCMLACFGAVMALLIYLGDWMGPLQAMIWRYWVLYESFMAVFLAVGLIVAFREFFSGTGTLQKTLARSAFTAYILHNLFVVPFQVLFDASPLGPWARFIAVSVLSIVCAFASADLFLRGKTAIRKLRNKRNTGAAMSG